MVVIKFLSIVGAVLSTGGIGYMMAGQLPFPQDYNTLIIIGSFCITWSVIITSIIPEICSITLVEKQNES